MLIGLSALAFLLILECVVRYLRYGEFPLYDTDPEVGYFPRPSQAGCMQGKFPWMFNEFSMRNEGFVSDVERNVLLLGDSIVYGEVRMKSGVGLGPNLQRRVLNAYRVWSVGAGSWSVMNEIAYLRGRRIVAEGVRHIVWLVNADDFAGRSNWRDSYTHPRRAPLWLTGYLLRKRVHLLWRKFLRHGRGGVGPSFSDEVHRELTSWLRESNHIGVNYIWIWYPHKADVLRERDEARKVKEEFKAIVKRNGGFFYDLGQNVHWDASCYKDLVHPTLQGYGILADILASLLIGDKANHIEGCDRACSD